MSGLYVHGDAPHGDLPAADATPAGLVTLRWSTHGYTTAPSDTPANTHYDGRLVGDVQFEQAITIGRGFVGRAALGFGELALWDADGDLASLLDAYAIDGRALRIKVADASGARIGAWPASASLATVFNGSAAGWRRDSDTVRVRLRDVVSRLDVPAQVELYGGTGGLDGPDQLRGLPKPQTWGQAFNVAPVYLGVVDLGFGLLATFQVHYRAIDDVTAVRERGAEITRVASTPGIGQFVVLPASGVFQLGFTPAGTITADVRGDASPWYAFTPGKLALRIGVDLCGLLESDFDLAALDDFDAASAGTVGVHVSSSERARAIDVVEALVGGAGGFITQTRAGLLRVGMLAAPDLLAHASLDVADIRAIEPSDLPDSINPPPKRAEVGFARNYAPSDDLAGAVSGAARTALAQPWRSAAAFSGDVATAHVLAQQMPLFGSSYADEAPAQLMADSLLDLYRPGRRLLRVVTGRYLGTLELGLTVSVTYPLLGLASGWRGVIVGLREDWLRGAVELTLFG